MHRAILILAAALAIALPLTASAAAPQTIEAPRSNGPATQPAAAVSSDLGNRLNQAASQNSENVEAQLNHRLYRFLSEEPAAGDEDLAKLSPEDRDLVTAITQGLTKFRAITRGTPDATMGEKIQPMLEMADALRDRANLTVNNLTLCDSVERFGIYEAIASASFPAGKDTPAIVYCEVENFHPRQTAEGMWETKLKYELAMYSEASPSKVVFSKPATPVIDRCRTRRRDFFLADNITLPKKLAAGRYVLKVTLTDEQAKKVGEATLPVEIR
jgi:hypothetical protein